MRVVVVGACGPAGVNVCRALDQAGHEVIGLDENPLHLPFGKRHGTMLHAAPIGTPAFEQQLHELDADAVHSQPAAGLEWLAARRGVFPVCIPSSATIAATLDKKSVLATWNKTGLRSKPVVVIEEPQPDHLHIAADALGLPFWLRANRGSGARGATLVDELPVAHHWIRYWQTRGVEWEWIAEEYLPGRDYCWTSLWQHGRLIAAFTRERLEWIYPHLAPSGRTGTPAVSVTVHEELVAKVAMAAVTAIDPHPHGIYCVDLREDHRGRPAPTEINAGRWATTSPLYSPLGPNLVDLHAQACAGEPLHPLGIDIYPSGRYLLRHIDCGSRLVFGSELEAGLADAA